MVWRWSEVSTPKSLEALKPVDILITMGCGVSCPTLPCRLREDWGLEDPTGCGDAAYENVIQQIRQNVLELRRRLEKGLILINAGTNIIRFVPPLVITKENVDEMLAILTECLDEKKTS